MRKLKYTLNNDGFIIGIGYRDTFENEVDETTPFQTIAEAMNWRKIDGLWVWYDHTWMHDEFDYELTIDQTDILDTDDYVALIGHVKGLIQSGNAKMETINGARVMYFKKILPQHKQILDHHGNYNLRSKH